MLTQLTTIKSRLALTVTDYDYLLTSAIKAVSDRFDKECNRNLARTAAATHEFEANDTEILPPCYPVEAVTKFELKSNESDGWTEQTGVQYLIRRQCVSLSLTPSQLSQLSTINHQLVGRSHHIHRRLRAARRYAGRRPDGAARRSRTSRRRTGRLLVSQP